MRLHRPLDRRWDTTRLPPHWATAVPDRADVEQEPQIAPVALLHAATLVTVTALESRHGVLGEPSDEVFEHPDCASVFIARLALFRCRELYDLLAAFRIALRREHGLLHRIPTQS